MSYSSVSLQCDFPPWGTSTQHTEAFPALLYIDRFIYNLGLALGSAGWHVLDVPPIGTLTLGGTMVDATFFMQHALNDTPSFWGITFYNACDGSVAKSVMAVNAVPASFMSVATCGTTTDPVMECGGGFDANCAGEGHFAKVYCGPTAIQDALQDNGFNLASATTIGTNTLFYITGANPSNAALSRGITFGASLKAFATPFTGGGINAITQASGNPNNKVGMYVSGGFIASAFEARVQFGGAGVLGVVGTGSNHPINLPIVLNGTGSGTDAPRSLSTPGLFDGWEVDAHGFMNPYQCFINNDTGTSPHGNHLDVSATKLVNFAQSGGPGLQEATFGVVSLAAFNGSGFNTSPYIFGAGRVSVNIASPLFNGGTGGNGEVQMASLQSGRTTVGTNGIPWFDGSFPLSEPWIGYNPLDVTAKCALFGQLWDCAVLHYRTSTPASVVFSWDGQGTWVGYTTNGGLGVSHDLGAYTLIFRVTDTFSGTNLPPWDPCPLI